MIPVDYEHEHKLSIMHLAYNSTPVTGISDGPTDLYILAVLETYPFGLRWHRTPSLELSGLESLIKALKIKCGLI